MPRSFRDRRREKRKAEKIDGEECQIKLTARFSQVPMLHHLACNVLTGKGTVMEDGTALPRMLADCKVLDFTQYLAGPTVTRLMAEMGANIIKVEPGPGGDPSRLLPFIKEGRSGYFVQQNRGKKSLCIDFNKPEGLDVIRSLAKTVDVVVENFGPGVMEKRGLDYVSLKQINPKIIMVSISAFGRKSPLSHRVGYDLIAQAFSGIMHMTGEADGPPQFVGLGIADVSSGVHAFAALGYALYYREKTGVGQHIDLAMIDALYHMHEVNVQVHTLSGGAYVPRRSGSHHPLVCPVGTFKGPKGWIVLLALDRQWEGVCKALGRPELVTDPRFATGPARGKNQEELIAIIDEMMEKIRELEAEIERWKQPPTTSQNSSQPPSRDFKADKVVGKKRGRSKKKGAKFGHEKQEGRWVENPTQVIEA